MNIVVSFHGIITLDQLYYTVNFVRSVSPCEYKEINIFNSLISGTESRLRTGGRKKKFLMY